MERPRNDLSLFKLKRKLTSNHTVDTIAGVVIPLLVFYVGYVVERGEEGEVLVEEVLGANV